MKDVYVSEEISTTVEDRNRPWGAGEFVGNCAERLVEEVAKDGTPRFTYFNDIPLDAWLGETSDQVLDRWREQGVIIRARYHLGKGTPEWASRMHQQLHEDVEALLEIIDSYQKWPYRKGER